MRKVAKPNAAEIAQRNVHRQSLVNERSDGLRNDYLTAVRGGHDPRAAIHRASIEIVVAALDRARVNAAANVQRDPAGRVPIDERSLNRQRRDDRVERIVEPRMNAVAGRFHDNAAVALHRSFDDRVVSRECPAHLLGLLLPQARAALDVGEQYGGE